MRCESEADRQRTVLGAAFAAFTLFVVYGSLVPLEFRPIPLEQALESYRQFHELNKALVDEETGRRLAELQARRAA